MTIKKNGKTVFEVSIFEVFVFVIFIALLVRIFKFISGI